MSILPLLLPILIIFFALSSVVISFILQELSDFLWL